MKQRYTKTCTVLYIRLFVNETENQQSRKEQTDRQTDRQTNRQTHYRKPTTNLYKPTVGNAIDKLFKYTAKRSDKHNTTL